ncbi:MAG: hypothetical protein LBQ47_07585 [Endomicrobium sp.]|nr:hypothetical protein [Endomicrobium sp.]
MICPDEMGIYLFLYKNEEDSYADEELLFETMEDVFDYAENVLKIHTKLWQDIPMHLEGCQQDWISPVRVLGRDKGNPEFGKFEKLVNNEWIPIK